VSRDARGGYVEARVKPHDHGSCGEFLRAADEFLGDLLGELRRAEVVAVDPRADQVDRQRVSREPHPGPGELGAQRPLGDDGQEDGLSASNVRELAGAAHHAVEVSRPGVDSRDDVAAGLVATGGEASISVDRGRDHGRRPFVLRCG
jgi:hypothetical protein